MTLNHLRYYFSTKEVWVVGLIFSFNSFLFGNWVTRIPDVKSTLMLSDADLGLALLGAPVGAMMIMPLAGWLIAHFRLGRVVWVSSMLHLASPILLSLAPNYYILVFGLFYFGLTNALMDIAMNAAAAATEKKVRRPIMSTCHGMWSLGAMLGSGLGSLFLGLDVAVQPHLISLAAGILFVVLLLFNRINAYHEQVDATDKTFAFPNLSLLGLAFMGFCILLSEGAIADWSAVYMTETLLSNPFLVGLSYSGFSMAMAVGRFLGDSLIPKIGPRKILFYGGIFAVVGLGATLLMGDPLFSIVGFSLTGLGYSCIVPVLFSLAANEPGYTPGTGIAAVTTIGYTGFLIGPPLIGFLSEAYSLPAGLALVVVLSGGVSVLSLLVRLN